MPKYFDKVSVQNLLFENGSIDQTNSDLILKCNGADQLTILGGGGLDANGNIIQNVDDPVNDMDVVNKRYLGAVSGTNLFKTTFGGKCENASYLIYNGNTTSHPTIAQNIQNFYFPVNSTNITAVTFMSEQPASINIRNSGAVLGTFTNGKSLAGISITSDMSISVDVTGQTGCCVVDLYYGSVISAPLASSVPTSSTIPIMNDMFEFNGATSTIDAKYPVAAV